MVEEESGMSPNKEQQASMRGKCLQGDLHCAVDENDSALFALTKGHYNDIFGILKARCLSLNSDFPEGTVNIDMKFIK